MIKEDLVKPDLLFVGTEFGLWVSIDGGKSWAQFKGNHFPAVAVRDLAIHPRDNDLVLATHGRGIWIVDDITPLRALTPDLLKQDVAFVSARPVQQRIEGQGGWANGDAVFVGENPPDAAVINYYQRERHLFGKMKLEILDSSGRVVDQLPASKRPGLNRVMWTMRAKPPRVPPAAQIAVAGIRGPRLVPGDYTVRLTKAGKVYDTKLTVGLDRRAKFSAADRKAQFDAAMRVHALFGDESALMDRIIGLRQALAQTGAAVPEGDPLRKQISDFDGKVDAVRKKIVATTEGGAITGEERLREHTDQLYGAILSYEGKPAAYQIAYIDTLRRELDDVTKQFDQLLAQDLPALNDSLKSKGQQPTFASAGESRDERCDRQRDWRRCRRALAPSSGLPHFVTSPADCDGVHIRKHSSGSAEDWKLIFRATMERTPAVAVVFHHIGPYHHARLNAAADKLPVTGIEWSARAYDAWGAAATPARYRKVSLFPEATDHHPGKGELRSALWSALEQTNPDVVAVNGWNNFGSLIAANCCVRRGIPMVVMSESSRQDEPRIWWKEAIKRRIVGLYSAALIGGQRHVEYLVELGMPRDRIFTGYDVVDNNYFGGAPPKFEIRNSKFEMSMACRRITFWPQRGSSRRRILQRLFSGLRGIPQQVANRWERPCGTSYC